MTTIAMGAGMTPIALGLGMDPSFHTLGAIVVTGGLIPFAILSLLAIPVRTTYVDNVVQWLSRRMHRNTIVAAAVSPLGGFPARSLRAKVGGAIVSNVKFFPSGRAASPFPLIPGGRPGGLRMV